MMTLSDYFQAFESSVILPERITEVEKIAAEIIKNSEQYREVSKISGVPWMAVSAIHSRESSLRFDRHLHNGDPLTAKTVHVPSGRPFVGSAPFSWVESAVDTLSTAWKPSTWSVAATLEFFERYNGMGYAHRGIQSPYLWSFTSAYKGGLFVSDGHFDPNAQCKQAGCVAILKALAQKGVPLAFTLC